MADLQDIKECEINILNEVVKICDKHNIKYWLAAGTLLGAVRHKGFIPWDDDIDIFIELSNIKKFKRICKQELPDFYFYQDNASDKTRWIYPKIRDKRTFMPQKGEENRLYCQGIWIDVLPLFHIAKSDRLFRIQVKALHKYQYNIGNIVYISIKSCKGLLKFIYRKFREIFFYRIPAILEMAIVKLLSNRNSDYFWFSIRFYGDFSEENFEKIKSRVIPKSVVEMDRRLFSFENDVYYGFKDYDIHLKRLYGDNYMTPVRYTNHQMDYDYVKINY